MNLTAFTDYQITCMCDKTLVCHMKTCFAGTDIDQFDFFLPVCNKADILIGGIPNHKIRIVISNFVKCFHSLF